MRILHLAKYYWPRSGGMERVVQSLAEGAASLGHQVEVVAVETPGRAGGASRQRSSVTRAFSLAALGHQEIAPGYIAAAWKRADIIHVHHPHPLADVACLLRAGRTPVVVTQHADSRRSIGCPSCGSTSWAPGPKGLDSGRWPRRWRSRAACAGTANTRTRTCHAG